MRHQRVNPDNIEFVTCVCGWKHSLHEDGHNAHPESGWAHELLRDHFTEARDAFIDRLMSLPLLRWLDRRAKP